MQSQSTDEGLRRAYIDTNCFLHLRDLKDLPWRDLFPGLKELNILVTHIVIDELDRLKAERAGRLRDRARSALKLIEQASGEPGMRLCLRQTPTMIWLVIAEDRRIVWERYERLDPTRPDDQLIAAALSDTDLVRPTLVSHDAGPLIRARTVGLPAQRSPEDWELPPQQDKQAQDLAKLQRENAALKAAKPSIELVFPDADAEGVIHFVTPKLEALPKSVVTALVEAANAHWPLEHIAITNHGFPYSIGMGGISAGQVAAYEAQYGEFIGKVRHLAENLHLVMALALRYGEIVFDIENPSQVTAEGLRVQASSPDGAKIFGDVEELLDVFGAVAVPEPPSPPRDYMMGLPDHLLRFAPESHDPTDVTTLHRPNPSSTVILTCDEFRPTVIWRDSVFGACIDGSDLNVTFEIGARNLPEPVRARVRCRRVPGNITWNEPAVIHRLPAWMAEVIKNSA